MYLKKLYQHSKVAFIILIAACFVQTVIFIKQGAVATPFLNFGMYSNKIYPEDEYMVYKIYANGELLKGADFSIQAWDKLYLPLYMFLGKDTVNDEMLEIQNRLLSKLKLPLIADNNQLFINKSVDAGQFFKWYKNYVSSILNTDVHQLDIVKQRYKWNNTYLQPIDSTALFQ